MVVQNLLSIITYLFLIYLLILFIKKTTRAHRLLILPSVYIILTFALYITQLIFDNPILILTSSLIFSLSIICFLNQALPKEDDYKPHFSLILLALITTILLMIPRISFLIFSFSWDTVVLPSLGDETKHMAVLTSLIAGNRSLPFPYDPSLPFPYYYLYYLLPSIVLKIFTFGNAGIIWFIHVLMTQLSFFSVSLYLISRITKKLSISLMAFFLLVFGSSFKLFPKIFHWYGVTEPHIEHWFQIPFNNIYNNPTLVGWQISHPVTIAIWTPQHEFAAMVILLLIALLIKNIPSIHHIAFTSILLTVIFGSSAFLGIAILSSLFVWTLLRIANRRFLLSFIIALAGFLLLTFPLIFALHNNQANIVFKPYLSTAPFLPKLPGALLFYFIETGFFIPLLIYLVIKYLRLQKPNGKDTIFYILFITTFLPLILSRLFQSAFMNDFGMRVPILYIITAPLLFIFLIEKIKLSKKISRIIVILVIINLLPGILAGLLEIYFQSNKFEKYPVEASRTYRLVNKYTSPHDIIMVNDAYTADRLPILSSRLTIQTALPFSLDVYVPKRPYKGGKYYSSELCGIFKQLENKKNPYQLVYLELQNYHDLGCKEITAAKEKAKIIYSSPAMVLYRL